MNPQNQQPVIAIFGSHSPEPGSPLYETARELGRRLAEAGFAVMTGGYEGTMAAASQGAAESGGYVIGVTSAQVESSRDVTLNQWVSDEIKYHALQDRLSHLVRKNDGMVVVEGGIGTLSELAFAWSLLQVREIPHRPLVVLGDLWEEILPKFLKSGYVSVGTAGLIKLVQTPAAAVEIIKAFYPKIVLEGNRSA
ncbi:MAG: LOG family protein [Candidatus Promineifilaceae bacterium]|jgi:hypothetical protein